MKFETLTMIPTDRGLVRLSVGIEHKDDLLEDIEQALKKASSKKLP